MSRVDDASADRRAEEAQAAERLAKERLQKQRTAEATTFDRALAARSQKAASEPRAPGRDAEELGAPLDFEASGEAREEPLARHPGAVPRGRSRPQPAPPRLGSPATEPGEHRAAPGEVEAGPEGERAQELRAPPRALGKGRARPDLKVPGKGEAAGKGSRRPDAKTEDINREVVEGGPRRAEACAQRGAHERGGSGDSGGSGKDSRGSGGSESMASFKLPPAALMAPPPLARPKVDPGARLLGATKEIVDKIVSRVLVGMNERGVPEFRLELKSSVLKGLSIRISGGRGGRIRAVFSGSDREVLASLRKTSQGLKDALAARGLTLEELVIDDAG